MKLILGALGAGVIAAALLSSPAEARQHCVWEGNHWRCWQEGPHAWTGHPARMHHKHAEIRRDRQRVRRLEAELRRDIHSGSSAAEIRHDRRRLHRAKRELREDMRDLRWGE